MRGADKAKTRRARALRKSDNEAEWKFWLEVRNRRLNGYKFVRQEPIGPYFADFACREFTLVIELDGSQHVDDGRDIARNRFINENGWSVARFWSFEVLLNMTAVLETVLAICDGRISEIVQSRDFNFFPATGPG